MDKCVKISLLLCLCLFSCWTGVKAAPDADEMPAFAIMKKYEEELPYMDFFEPYTVCILALNELEKGRMQAQIKNYIDWYFAHLNYPDKHELTGTIYDYVIRDEKEYATRKYNSIDGYAGVFLHLLNKYVTVTGDVTIIKNNWQKIEDIAYTIVYMQDEKDGLTRALPTTDQKYLRNNCEAYGGIRAYNQLRSKAGMDKSKFYENKEAELKHAVLELYDYSDNSFIWVIEDGRSHGSDWNTYYPDAYAQLFPIYYGILDSNRTLAENFWYNFNLHHGQAVHQFPIEQRLVYELTKKKLLG